MNYKKYVAFHILISSARQIFLKWSDKSTASYAMLGFESDIENL